MEVHIFYALVFLNVFQTIYWSWQTHKLVNKIMSRDYPSYANAVVEIKPKDDPQPQNHEVSVPFIP